jgi:hypothetical protein
MSTANISIVLNTYSNTAQTNTPSLQNIRWQRTISNIAANNPASNSYTLNAQTSITAFSTTGTAPAPSNTQFIEDTYVLNSTDIANKGVTLSNVPLNASEAILDINGAPEMFYGIQYTISGKFLTWANTEIDGIISVGDVVRVIYQISVSGGGGGSSGGGGATSTNPKQFIYIESDSPIDIMINGISRLTINPFYVGTAVYPGVFMMKGSFTSLSIANTSSTAIANVFVASME